MKQAVMPRTKTGARRQREKLLRTRQCRRRGERCRERRESSWAEPLRDALRQNRGQIAADRAVEIEFVRSKKSFRKERRAKGILAKRGEEPGLVCILPAMEPCSAFQSWGCATCGCRPGVHSGSRSTATATAIWHGS